MVHGALIEVDGGACERAMCLGDSYRLGRGTDCHGCEMFWQGIAYDCCSGKVWFNLFCRCLFLKLNLVEWQKVMIVIISYKL